ncbi:MAG: condensation domain-containing protein [Clostridiales bacterium]|jgi:acetone carboxylase gamma subunit|nr:condensation domain-containing protein [Clostridiales bacterium]
MSDKKYPLSAEQYGYYNHWKNTGKTTAVPFRLEYENGTDVKRLAESFVKVVNAHKFLKANVASGDVPYWVRNDDAEVSVKIFEVSSEEFEKIQDDFFQQPELNPDMAKDPLYYFAVFRVDGTGVYALGGLNHIYYDGITRDIIIEDIIRAYNGEDLAPDGGAGFEEGNYEVAAQKSEKFAESVLFYDELFKHYKEVILDFKNAPDAALTEGTGIARLPLESAKVNGFCAKTKISPNVLFLAGLCRAANALSGEEHLFFGSNTAGRAKRGINREAGLFVRNFPLILKIDASLEGIDFVKSIKEQYYNILKNHTEYTSSIAQERHGFKVRINYLFQAGIGGADEAMNKIYPKPACTDTSWGMFLKVFIPSFGNVFDIGAQVFETKVPQFDNQKHYVFVFSYNTEVYADDTMKKVTKMIGDFIKGVIEE